VGGGGQEAVFTIRGLFLEYFGDIQRAREIDREVMAIFLFWERNFGFLFFF
jgi:hypothetical protein